jgi:quercetin dioxygenase-like cupin family protein
LERGLCDSTSSEARTPSWPHPTAPPEAAAGARFHNPATGEIARLNVGPAETGGRRIEVDLWLQPGAAVARAHIHDHFIERFEVLAGEVGFQLAGDERVAHPGDSAVEVPAGTVHDWWNAGDGVAHVRVEVAATPDAPGRPAARFGSMIETLWSLGALGRVNAQGLPDPLWLAAIAREYRDTIRFTKPPAAVQAALFGPLAAIARRTGRDPLAAELHGPAAACAIPDPGENGLAALLARPVGARAARGRSVPGSRRFPARRGCTSALDCPTVTPFSSCATGLRAMASSSSRSGTNPNTSASSVVIPTATSSKRRGNRSSERSGGRLRRS